MASDNAHSATDDHPESASDNTQPAPRRARITRHRPWRQDHPDAVRVDRGTRWGNPFTVAEHGRARAVQLYRAALLAGELPITVEDVRRELAGRTLACWCALDEPDCHAEVLAEIANPQTRRRRGRAPVPLPTHLEPVHARYTAALAAAPVDQDTRRAYASRVRQYLAWLADAIDAGTVDGDPLAQAPARDWAVRDYRTHLQIVAKRKPSTINTTLAALGDFYTRLGLGAPDVRRLDLPQAAPRALTAREATRLLRVVQRSLSPRDQVLALILFYAGLRIGETVALDVDDIRLSARKCLIRVRSGKGGRYREIPAHPELRETLAVWINDERPAWPGADTNPALLLNHRGGRLSTRGASNVLTALADYAGLGEEFTGHVLRHTFGTTLVRDGHDLVLVAELMGHARVETTRAYALPTAADRERAINSLPTDR